MTTVLQFRSLTILIFQFCSNIDQSTFDISGFSEEIEKANVDIAKSCDTLASYLKCKKTLWIETRQGNIIDKTSLFLFPWIFDPNSFF